MGYRFTAERSGDDVGVSLASGDFDGDGNTDLLIASVKSLDASNVELGGIYLINGDELAAADAADGATDQIIELGNVADLANSYRLLGEAPGDQARAVTAGDVDNDGKDDILIGALNNDEAGTDFGAVYLINADDLAAADAADSAADGQINLANIAAQADSYKFLGDATSNQTGVGRVRLDDFDGDGQADITFTARDNGGSGPADGQVFLLNADAVAAADAADGSTDGKVAVANIPGQTASYRFDAEGTENALNKLTVMGDVDGDGQVELGLGAPNFSGISTQFGAAYILDDDEIAAADAADGATDGIIDVGDIAAQNLSYRFVGDAPLDRVGSDISIAGDIDGDGQSDIVIGADGNDGGASTGGAIYILDDDAITAADAADASTNGLINAENITGQALSYKIVGDSIFTNVGSLISTAGDFDGDGQEDIVFNRDTEEGSVFLVDDDALAAADAADGSTDGTISVTNIPGISGSYRFVGEANGDDANEFAVVGDTDGDGNPDLLIGAPSSNDGGFSAGAAYLAQSSNFAAYDAADGSTDGVIDLASVYCFAPGTQIATPSGERAVEDLRAGQHALNSDGQAVPILWIGRHTVCVERAGANMQPVRIRAGALGPTVPTQDLVVTADHGIIVDGFVVNAQALINGVEIDWVPWHELPNRVTFYHIETEAHDVIVANGALSETFVDAASRAHFDNYDEYLALFGADRLVPEMTAMRITSQRLLPDDIKRRLGLLPISRERALIG